MDDDHATRVPLVVWSHCRFAREALAAYLSGLPRFHVLGHTATAEGLRRLCVLTRPQIVVTEVDEFSTATAKELVELRQQHPVETVVLYTSLVPDAYAQAAQAGILSFVPSSAGLDAVARTILFQARRPRAPGTGQGHALTERELAVISLMTSGHTNEDIAALLGISPHTVDNHRRRVYSKLGVGNQSAAVATAVSLGMVSWPWTTNAPGSHRFGVVSLTTREEQILQHMAQGHTTRQIARALGVAVKTVENTQARLYRKLGTHSRSETLAVAYRLGLLDELSRPS